MNSTNIKKTIRYCKKNGFLQAVYAVCEKIREKKQKPYQFIPITQEIHERRQKEKRDNYFKISIIVPAFETKEEYLKAMIESVLDQTYQNLELIIADASSSLRVQRIVNNYNDARIIYQKLEGNLGISDNSNQALLLATGDYIGLLDHDDLLTKDAIYEVVKAIEAKQKEGIQVTLLYSDEDKTNEDGTKYFDPHYKEDFNLDLLLSNNYICHFAVIEKELIKKIKFRKEYDGAQDYDIILRTAGASKEDGSNIVHIRKILYHWRCHSESTAENPTSKMYAYEAGKNAITAFIDDKGWQGSVTHTKHLGFYHIKYPTSIWKERNNVAAVGGPIVKRNLIISGAMNKKGKPLYGGLPKQFSGYMKKASLQQQVEVLDIRNMKVNPECIEIYEDVLKLFDLVQLSNNYNKKNDANRKLKYTQSRNPNKLKDVANIHLKASIEFAKRVSEKGYLLIYDPAE